MSTATLPSQEEQDEHQRVVITGGIKGFFGGLGVALPLSYILHRRWPYYHSLQPSLKAFGVILIAVPSFVISAERAGLNYERQRWSDIGKRELDEIKEREKEKWKRMSLREKLGEVAVKHPFSLITGSWAASMVGIYAYFSRDPLATPLQKITQTRVFAQGITLGIVISAAILAHRHAGGTYVDHSWRDMVQKEQEEERRQNLRMKQVLMKTVKKRGEVSKEDQKEGEGEKNG